MTHQGNYGGDSLLGGHKIVDNQHQTSHQSFSKNQKKIFEKTESKSEKYSSQNQESSHQKGSESFSQNNQNSYGGSYSKVQPSYEISSGKSCECKCKPEIDDEAGDIRK